MGIKKFPYWHFHPLVLYFNAERVVSLAITDQMTSKDILMVIGLFLIVFIMGADSFIISPLLPAIERDYNVNLSSAALAVIIYALCYAIGSPFFGPLGDRFEKKRILTIGIGIFLAGSLLCAIATTLGQFYVYRAIAGIGAALTMPNIWAIIGDHFRGHLLNTIMGITMSALSLSIAIGVPLGTELVQISNWHMAFWGSAGLTLIAYFALLVVIPNMSSLPNQRISYLDSFRTLLTTHHATWALSINLVWMFGFYTVYTFLGTYIEQTFHDNTAQTGLVFVAYGISNFIASFFGGIVTTKLGAMRSVIINGLLSVIFIFGMAFIANTIPLLITFLILLALAQGLGVTALTTYIVNVVPKNRSTIMSFNSSFLYLGLTLGSLIGGIVYPHWAFKGVGLCAVAGLLIAVMITKWLSSDRSQSVTH